jgi:hypothetical protein
VFGGRRPANGAGIIYQNIDALKIGEYLLGKRIGGGALAEIGLVSVKLPAESSDLSK